MDLIERQKAIDALADMHCKSDEDGYVWIIRSDAWARIDALPSVQSRKGKWIDYSDEGYVECPFCHSATNCEGNKDELHYCFSCGAELR